MTDADAIRATVNRSRRMAVIFGVALVVSATVTVLATAPVAGHGGGSAGATAAAPDPGNESFAGERLSPGSVTDFASATRTIEEQELPPGGTTTVTLDITIEEAAGKISINDGVLHADAANPSLERVDNLSVEFQGGSGSTEIKRTQNTGIFVGATDVSVGTTIVVTYDVTVTEEPEKLGDLYIFRGNVQSNEHPESVDATGDSEINVITTTATATATTTSTTTTATTTSTTTTTTTDRPGNFQGWWSSPVKPALGETVTFVALGSGGASYEWDIDNDGTYEKTGRTAVHTFETTGEHTVLLRITGVEDGPIMSKKSIQVEGEVASTPSQTEPSFWFSPTDPLSVERVTFVADPAVPTDSVAAVHWDFDGDGSADERGEVVSHEFGQEGSHVVELQIERTDGETYTVKRTVNVAGGSTSSTTTTTTTATETTTDGNVDVDVETPGFGVPLAVAAVVVALLLARRRADE